MKGGKAVVESQTKSAAASSQRISPSVKITRMLSRGRRVSQCSTSLLTHEDWAESGDASRMKCSELSRADSIDDHNPGVAESPVLSRNTRTERNRLQGLANCWSPDCRAGANLPSAACEYERKASYSMKFSSSWFWNLILNFF